MHAMASAHARRWVPVLLGLLVLSACSPGTDAVADGFERRTTDAYEVLVPAAWDTVDDGAGAFQVVDPASDTPMTVRIVVTSRRVDDVATEAEALRAGIPGLSEDAHVVDERRRDVPGATGAVQLTSQATLTVAATGQEVEVTLIDLLARGGDGRLLAVKVQGPSDGFDDELAATVLSSLSLVSATARATSVPRRHDA